MMIPTPWLQCPQTSPQAALRLFCFPYAGAGASVFRTWSNQLPADIELCSIQLPGREGRLREPLISQMQPLLEQLIPALLPYFDRPFAFFGHSVGALIGFALTRQLWALGQPMPFHLFVSGRQPPQSSSTGPLLHQLPDPELIEALRRYNGTPDILLQEPDMMKLFLPILRADFSINETYLYERDPLLDFSISAFGGDHDPLVSTDALPAWGELTSGRFRCHLFPGDHFYLKPQQSTLLATIDADLRESLNDTTVAP